VKQLRDYIDEIRSDECIGGILIAKHFTKKFWMKQKTMELLAVFIRLKMLMRALNIPLRNSYQN